MLEAQTRAAFSVRPRLVKRFRLQGEPAGVVLERLAAILVCEARDGPHGACHGVRHDASHGGVVWLDSEGPTVGDGSESVLTAFPWRRARWDDPGDPGLLAGLDAFTEEPGDSGRQTDQSIGPGDGEDTRGLGFRGGWLGFLGYEAVQVLEPVRLQASRDLGVPVASWGLYPVWFRVPHGEDVIELWSRCSEKPGTRADDPGHDEWIRWAERAIAGELDDEESGLLPGAVSELDRFAGRSLLDVASRSFPREAFVRAVAGVKEAVREGEVFQANLAHRLSVATQVDPFTVYVTLRRLNPSPFMAFLEEDWGALVSNSPERLFCVRSDGDGRVVEARPIAGTRPRGASASEETRMREELCGSAKERAEHTMLVDLVRNDLGRVSEPGSVRVTRFQEVEAYSHVLHLVSRVMGRLRADVGFVGLLRALFPGGTITGAPKLRSIEVIDRFEPVARGPYTGSLGYVNPDGSMDLNILIRTLVFTGGAAHAYAGAGLVAQSVPEKEFEETLHKAAAMLSALALTMRPPVPQVDPLPKVRVGLLDARLDTQVGNEVHEGMHGEVHGGMHGEVHGETDAETDVSVESDLDDVVHAARRGRAWPVMEGRG